MAVLLAAGLLRLKGAYDATADLEEMKREKDKAVREPRVSICSLVKGRIIYILCCIRLLKLFLCYFCIFLTESMDPNV